MKYIDVRKDMSVKVTLHDNVTYTGKVLGMDSDCKAVCVEFENNKRSWFYEGNRVTSLASVEHLDGEVSNTSKSKVNKIPKFDKSLLDSDYFKEYFHTLVDKYREEYMPYGGIESIDVHSNGRIVIKDSYGNKGVSKCHRNDAFNIEVGLRLAFQRLVDDQSFIPKDGDSYFAVTYPMCDIVEVVYLDGEFTCLLDKTMGNCFRTKSGAEKHKEDVFKQFEKILEYSGGLANAESHK